MKELLRLLVLFAVMLVGPVSGALADDSIQGDWQVSRIDHDNRAEPNLSPQPSVVIFTEKHYSIVWTLKDSAMRANNKRWAPTDEEKLKRFDEVVVNAGTYELEGSQLKTYPLAAKDPELIGGGFDYTVNWSNGNLVLTLMDEYSFDDVKHPWIEDYSGQVHVTLTRITE